MHSISFLGKSVWGRAGSAAGLDHHAHLRVASLHCKKEPQNSRDVCTFVTKFYVCSKAMFDEWMIRKELGKSHECRSAWHMLVDYYYASLLSRFRRGFNRLCFDTTQLFEDVLCRTALPQSNLHASSPSKSTTASFISTNLTIHSSQSSLFAVREYLSPVSPVIRDHHLTVTDHPP